MTRKDRRRSQQWHFSDSGSRFDRKRLYTAEIDHHPISKTFTRKIIHCKRCGSRVVSNVSHCPYCGKSLLPLFKRFWFWLIIVAIIGTGAVALIIYSPQAKTSTEKPETPMPVVVGSSQERSFKDLPLGTTVDCNNLLVTVSDSTQITVTADGTPITAVEVQFINKGDEAVLLYLTQWQIETKAGARIDSEATKTEDGKSIVSELDSRSLAPKETYSAILYFAANEPSKIVFAPEALTYSDERLVSWMLRATTSTSSENQEGSETGEGTAPASNGSATQ